MSFADFSSPASKRSRTSSKITTEVSIHDYERENAELRRTVRDLRLQLANREEQFTQAMLNGHIDADMIQEFLESTRNMEEKEAELRRLSDELEEARQTIEYLRGADPSLSESNAQSPQRFSHTSPVAKQVTSLKMENSRLQNLCATKEAQNAELIVENLALRSQIGDYENDSSLSSFHKSRLRSHNKRLADTLTKARGAIATLTDEARQTEAEKGRARSVVESVQSRITGLEDEMQQLIDAFNSDASQMEHQIENIVAVLEQKFGDVKAASHEAVTQIASLCAKLANVNEENIPEADDLCNDPETLKFFIGRIETSFEMHQAAQRAENRKLEAEARSAKAAKKVISPEVAQAVKNIQGRVAELTKTLHRDHKQLIDVLTMESEGLAE